MSSSVFRITQQTMTRQVYDNLQNSLDRLQKIQEQLSSGKQINRPSDDPAGAVLSLRLRSSLDRIDQYSRNLDDAKGWLNLADSAINAAVEQSQRAREIYLRGMSGASGTQDKAAIAAEIRKIRDGVIESANTRYLDRPIFAGNSGATSAYDTSGNFIGDTGAVDRNIAPGVTMRVNVDATQAFGSGAASIFAVLDKMANDLETPGVDLNTGLTQLDAALNTMTNALSDVGARTNRLETLKDRTQADQINLKSTLSEAEDIDVAKTILELQLQQNAYQAALGATAKVIQPSLADFLR